MVDNPKLKSVVSFKIPKFTKQAYDTLTKEQKKILHHKLRLLVAEAIHMSKFNSRDYLGDDFKR